MDKNVQHTKKYIKWIKMVQVLLLIVNVKLYFAINV